MDASASKANLLMKCGYWARKEIIAPPYETSEHASYGLCVHALTEAHGTGVPVDQKALQLEHNLSDFDFERAKIDALALFQWHTARIKGDKYHEQKVALDTKAHTARVLESPIPRDYSDCKESEFPGTADLIAVRTNSLTVIDYKTGSTPWEIYKEQLLLLGLAASKIYKKDKVYCVVLKVSDGQCYPHHWLVERPGLDEFEQEFVRAYNNVPNSEPVPGEHCTGLYCPLAGTCPASLGLITEATGIDTSGVAVDGGIRDAEHFVQLYRVSQLLTKSKKTLTLSLKKFVDTHGGQTLPNGKVYEKKNGSYKETRT